MKVESPATMRSCAPRRVKMRSTGVSRQRWAGTWQPILRHHARHTHPHATACFCRPYDNIHLVLFIARLIDRQQRRSSYTARGPTDKVTAIYGACALRESARYWQEGGAHMLGPVSSSAEGAEGPPRVTSLGHNGPTWAVLRARVPQPLHFHHTPPHPALRAQPANAWGMRACFRHLHQGHHARRKGAENKQTQCQ